MAFFYSGQHLRIGTENCHLDAIAVAKQFDAPIYIYDLDALEKRYRAFVDAFGDTRFAIHYALKANSNEVILRRLAKWGAGVDTVSGGEIHLALAAGIPPERIIFSGVGKTREEIKIALAHNIKQINIESPAELLRVEELASEFNCTCNVALRINPNVNPQTHPYITTGFKENKFGMDDSFLPELRKILIRSKSHLKLVGLTMHIGSQLLELDALEEAIEKTALLFKGLQAEGFALDRLDIGGGLGIDYSSGNETTELERIRDYGKLARRILQPLGCEIELEPGRIIVARIGLLIGEVQYIKPIEGKTFAILNTGMHHLLRPALYQAQHRILPLQIQSQTKMNYSVVGPICESSDIISQDIELPELKSGDYLAIADAGAYGFTMASRYNAHDLPIEVAVSQGKIESITTTKHTSTTSQSQKDILP
jgi:diaminopimelate decarboxylase